MEGASGPSFFNVAMWKTMGRFYMPYQFMQAKAGRNTTQMVANIPNVISKRPDLVVIMGGTNGFKGLQGWIDLRTCALAYLLGGAMYVVIMPCIPDDSDNSFTNGTDTTRRDLNSYIQNGASDPVVGQYFRSGNIIAAPSVDAGYDTTAMMIGDKRHPNWPGATYIATQSLVRALTPLITSSLDHLALYNDASNLLNTYSNNPQMLGTGGANNLTTGSVATGWQAGAISSGMGGVFSKVKKTMGAGTVQITGTTATISGYSGPPIQVGQYLSAASANTSIVQQISGTTGRDGTYQVNNSQSLASIATNLQVDAQRILVNGTGVSAGNYVREYNRTAFPFNVLAGQQYDMWVAFNLAAGCTGLQTIRTNFGSGNMLSLDQNRTELMDGIGEIDGVFRTYCFAPFAADGAAPLSMLAQNMFASSGTIGMDLTLYAPVLRLIPDP
ncbi:hypothetical protein [Bradyrhizobium sp. SEMIA]|uniref:hypothetical protein n=1 Tax=Bradyrhizobium sp. SEMIA TaxID=2597515 RepID=UPI0018A68ACF|nr:hypothetical protein [Bradyrhizobium sp. SEMIA]QOG20449.1 hypothetical protein FOM02_26950 [Bradyrhizobium sp. SEMIA]